MAEGDALINHPFRFMIEKEDGDIIHLEPGDIEFTDQTPSAIAWEVQNSSLNAG